MGISRKADYALRAMVELAVTGEPVSTRKLAEMTNGPYAFVAKIVAELAAHGFVELSRGRGGGVRLTADLETTTALSILEAVSGPLRLNNCVADPQTCVRAGYCALCEAFIDAQQRLEEALSVNLLTLATAQRRKLVAMGTS